MASWLTDYLLQFRPASDAGTFPLKSPATLETVALGELSRPLPRIKGLEWGLQSSLF